MPIDSVKHEKYKIWQNSAVFFSLVFLVQFQSLRFRACDNWQIMEIIATYKTENWANNSIERHKSPGVCNIP